MSKGKVKYFNELKGWGFINEEKEDRAVFVHHTDINMDGYKTLKEGQDVDFEVINTDSGLRAQNVRIAD